MSYARFGSSGSDVYVYLDVGGYLCCCACHLSENWQHNSTDEMIAHLEEHRAAGHCVPQDCIDDLLADKDENDEWIANFDPVEEQRKRDEVNQRIDAIRQIMKDELGYEHPGPERFDYRVHQENWDKATAIYERQAPSTGSEDRA